MTRVGSQRHRQKKNCVAYTKNSNGLPSTKLVMLTTFCAKAATVSTITWSHSGCLNIQNCKYNFGLYWLQHVAAYVYNIMSCVR